MADKIKWIVAALLVVGALAGFYWFEQYSMLIRVPALVAAAIICVVIVVQTTAGRQLVGFFRESQIEARKVVWPTGKETTQTTLVVMALVVVALFLWLVDTGLLKLVRMLTGQGG